MLFIPVSSLLPDIPEASTAQTDQVLVPVGDNLILSCDYDAVPTPDVTWLFDEQELQATSAANRSELLLTAVAVEDGGVYTCMAVNLLGQDSVTITVVIQGGACSARKGSGYADNMAISCVLTTANYVAYCALFLQCLLTQPLS